MVDRHDEHYDFSESEKRNERYYPAPLDPPEGEFFCGFCAEPCKAVWDTDLGEWVTDCCRELLLPEED